MVGEIARKGIFWIVLFVIFIVIAFILVYYFKTQGISFLSGASLKDIQWLP